MSKVLIIGFGRVGSHLCYAIGKMKNELLLPAIKNSHSKLNNESLSESDIIFICTQDDKIANAVSRIVRSGIDLKGKIAVHTSGSLSSDELFKLKKKGCSIASFHPVQTFPLRATASKYGHKSKINYSLFNNIYVAIEGDSRAVKILSKLASNAGSVPMYINKNFKMFHHICCLISSGFIVANLSFLKDIYTQINGFKNVSFFDIYKPLIYNTISNIESRGIEKSLTGPITRNDVKTISSHLRNLKRVHDIEIIDYYKLMSLRALKIAYRNRILTSRQSNKLKKLLNSK